MSARPSTPTEGDSRKNPPPKMSMPMSGANFLSNCIANPRAPGFELQRPLRARDLIPGHGHRLAERPAEGLEDRLGDVVVVGTTRHLDVAVELAGAGHGREELADELGVERADLGG